MKLVLGNPGWLELRLDGALWWRSVKARVTGSAKTRDGAPRCVAAETGPRPKRRRVFFDWP
jgi:hypothetical protein